MKKRAVALYRVSTDKQDYEMQRRKAKEYCRENNIEIIDEYAEFDVSGYKTQLKDRKELLKILNRAEEDKDFDYLIVYIFDRIIRREDEAPFVLSHLSKFNIECIEATTGEHMRNNDMTDKLMNYIRFWNAEYESVKTSQRVSDALRTKNEQNRYTGGQPAYGYELYDTDNYTKKGKRLKDIRINIDEAWIIRDIFDMYVNKRMGSLSIAEELNSNPLYKGRSKPLRRRDKDNPEIVHEIPTIWRQSSIMRMIRNTIYIGRMRYNTIETGRDGSRLLPQDEWKTQDYKEHLRIIDDDLFIKAQQIIGKNTIKPNEQLEGITKSEVLCSGLAYCECGAKLFSSFSRYNYTRKDGSVSEYGKIYRYCCRTGREMNTVHKEKYGKTYYAAKKYDNFIRETIIEYLNNIDMKMLKDNMDKHKKTGITDIQKSIDKLKLEKAQCYKNINNFEKRIDDDIDNMDIYIKGIRRNESRAMEIENEINELNDKLKENQQSNYDYKSIYDNYKSYYNDFVNGNLDKQKLILDKMVDKIIFMSDGVKIILKYAIEQSLVQNSDDKNTVYLPLNECTYRILNTDKTIGIIRVNFNDYKEVI